MFETVSTNGAAILTMLLLWSTLVGLVVYVYMGQKVADLKQKVDVLDWYAYYSDREIEKMMDEMHILRAEVEGKGEYIRVLCQRLDASDG